MTTGRLEMQGTLEWFNKAKGIGIIRDADGQRYFFRADDLKEPHLIFKGVYVTFDPHLSHRSVKARNVFVVRG